MRCDVVLFAVDINLKGKTMNQQTGATLVKYVSYILFINAFIWGSTAFPPIDFIGRFYLDLLHWPVGDGLPVFNQNLAWLSGIGAGLLTALGVVYLGIIYPAVRSGNRAVIKTAIIAGLAWFVVDSAGSIASGVGANAVINVITLIPLIGPLVMTKIEG